MVLINSKPTSYQERFHMVALYIAPYFLVMKRNVPIVGFVIGLLFPFIGLFIMYLLWGHHEGIADFLSSVMRSHDLAGKVFSLSLLANLAPFLYFTTKRLDYSARGVFIATMIYVLVIVLIKFVW